MKRDRLKIYTKTDETEGQIEGHRYTKVERGIEREGNISRLKRKREIYQKRRGKMGKCAKEETEMERQKDI